MAEKYIHDHYKEIQDYANVIEKRADDSYCTKELLIQENARNLDLCETYGCDYILIEKDYTIEIEL